MVIRTLEYKNPRLDREMWESGPWDNEPDKKQWADPATGLPCLIVRNSMGALCGYVGVPDTHPAYKKDYDEVDVQVHGGLTFADTCASKESLIEGSICHIAPEGEDDVWWLGFDTAHAYDLVPSISGFRAKRMDGIRGDLGDTYRDLDYVTGQVMQLAAQLHAMAN